MQAKYGRTVVLRRSDLVIVLMLAFGAMGVLGPPELSAAKVAYFVMFALVLARALITGADRFGPRLVLWTITTGCVFVGLSLLSVVRGNDPTNVARDAAPYFMIVAAAPIALRSGARCRPRTFKWSLLVVATMAGLVATLRFAGLRGFLTTSTVGFGSAVLPAAAIGVATALAVVSRRKAGWWALVVGLVLLLLASGTRSNLALVGVIPCTLVAAARAGRRRRLLDIKAMRLRWRAGLVRGLLVAPFVVVAAASLASLIGLDVTAASNRLVSVAEARVENTASLEERSLQTALAREAIAENVILGRGPGFRYDVYQPTSRRTIRVFTLDTPLVLPSKWGLLGTTFMVLLLVQWWRFFLSPARRQTVASMAFAGMVPPVLVYTIFTSLIEDKGLPIALILLGGYALSEQRGRSLAATSRPAAAPAAAVA